MLGLGIFSLTQGEEVRARWSNKLMRWRVMLQAIAIVLILVLAWAWRNGH
ncbi:MAG: twin transmembrane helix small protein [Asticcacaulis sp.]